ncbi:hypothetical protein [Shewanella gelidii]|uniref:Uncharacterized protein n=1 Tax=Shewanella gelidii TaxID=1642821 RepID=A0A917JJH2_9GAMM|nr:hypothetical protein [Shewanella gelidii]MCL1096903.1 hypothetical protein [Shewanella gelidii]GGI71049.1 hypothetical protein GCM10009332_05440 [Shewanella gelidii]
MFDAVCKQTDQADRVYSILEFQSLDPQAVEALRQHLFCPECGGKAYYRKASIDGKAACFGSRYHDDACQEFHPSQLKVIRDAQEMNQIVLESDALMIDFDHAVKLSQRNVAPIPDGQVDQNATNAAIVPGQDNTGRFETPRHVKSEHAQINQQKSPTHSQSDTKVSRQGLAKLLNSLMRGSALEKSDLWIYTDEKYRWRAKNLFVNFADAEPTENGSPRMYWGSISHADQAMGWLNPADCKDVGIPIDQFKHVLAHKFAVKEARDVEGAAMILFGRCFWNKDKSRKIIQIWGKPTPRFYIQKVEDD